MSGEDATVAVTAFGAEGDGAGLETGAIQDAIDDRYERGGGRVYVPPGVYRTGTITLRDDVTLELDAGATIQGSTDVEDYHDGTGLRTLIGAHDAENVAIVGKGRIDGQGQAFNEAKTDKPTMHQHGAVPTHDYEALERPWSAVRFDSCESVTVRDVTIANSAAWTLHCVNSDGICVDGVTIRAPPTTPNADGIDVDSCRNVRIANCDICSADDAIVLKNVLKFEPEKPSRAVRNVTVTNCTLATVCNAFKIGTETVGDIENVTVSNVTVDGYDTHDDADLPERYQPVSGPVSGLSIEMVDGATLRNVAVSNVTIRNARVPLFVRLGNRGRTGLEAGEREDDPTPGHLEGVSIENLLATDATVASSITGIPERAARNVSLADVRIQTEGGRAATLDTNDGEPDDEDFGADDAYRNPPELRRNYPHARMWGPLPAHGLFCRHVEGLSVRNVTVECATHDERPVLVCDRVSDCSIDRLVSDTGDDRDPAVSLRNVQQALLRDIRVSPDSAVAVGLEGADTSEVVLDEGTVFGGESVVDLGEAVPATALR